MTTEGFIHVNRITIILWQMNNRIAINMIQSYYAQRKHQITFILGSTLIPKRECAMVILSTLESLPTHIVTSLSTSICTFCNSSFELQIFATEPVSNTEGLLWTLVNYTSITCIYMSNIPLFTLCCGVVTADVLVWGLSHGAIATWLA